jgi:hypothetical protein
MDGTEQASKLRQKQLDEIILSISKLSAVAESVMSGHLPQDDAFRALKTAALDFIDAQDGVGFDENGGGTGLLADAEVLEAACRYLLRRGKSSEMYHLLFDFTFQRAQGSLST